jgi:hypothetical protein
MRTLLTLVLALAALSPLAHAQNIHRYSVVYSGTNTGVNAATTNSPGIVFNVEDVRQFQALLSYSLPAGTNGPVSVEFTRSPDGTTYESTAFVTLTLTSSGSAAGTAMTNFDVGAAAKLKLNRVVNLNTNHVTNLVLIVGAKKAP